jgi:hypothetical protein
VFWLGLYAGAAISVAVIAAAACQFHAAYVDVPAQWGSAAFLAGALWPIVLIGIAELCILFVMAKVVCDAESPVGRRISRGIR